MTPKRLLPLLLVGLLSTGGSARAQCADKASSHTGLSGIPPFEANESCFVDDDGAELDAPTTIYTGETDKDYFFHTTRYLGEITGDGFLADANSLLAEDLIAEKVTLSMVARITRTDVMGKLNTGYLDVQVMLNEGTSGEKDIGPLEGAYTYEHIGTRERWQLFELEVDTRDLRFPDDPGCPSDLNCEDIEPRQNKLTLKFTGTGVCPDNHPYCAHVEVDWISVGTTGDEGLAWRPTLMLHGLGGTAAGMASGPNQYANVLDGKGMAHHAIQMTPHGHIRANAATVTIATQDMKDRFGVDRIHAVGHSKGGLDARESVQFHNDIENLVMAGSPNEGTPLMGVNAMAFVDVMAFGIGLFSFELNGGGNLDMTVQAMLIYNTMYRPNTKTTYVTQAGSHQDCGVLVPFAIRIPGPDDCFVPVSSVHALPYSAKYTYATNDNASTHVGLRTSNTIGAQEAYADFLRMRTPHEASAPAMRTSDVTRWSPSTGQLKTSTVVSMTEAASVWQAGTPVEDSEVVPLTITVDVADSLVVFAQWITDDDIDVELVTPSAAHLTSSTMTPGVTYGEYMGEDMPPMAGFVIESPETGEWTIELHGTSVADVNGAWVSVDADLRGSAVTMQLATDQDLYDPSQPIVLSATLLESAVPVTGATVEAVLGDSSAWTYSTTPLLDDGLGDDVTAGDGVYTGSFAATGSGGMFPVGVTASRDSGTAFDRRTGIMAIVSDGTAHLTSTTSDVGVDTDADGYYDLLRISLEFDADVAGSYWFYGVLVDALSAEVEQVRAEVNLSMGTQTLDFDFDGTGIYDGDHDGPFQVQDVQLVESTTGLTTYTAALAHTTGAYTATQFQRPAILLTGTTNDYGLDLYGDEAFDELVIEVEVDLIYAGDYVFTAQLQTLGGALLIPASNVMTLPVGVSNIEFHFQSYEIISAVVDGPWQLAMLAMSGENLTTSAAAKSAIVTPEAWILNSGSFATTAAYTQEDFGGVSLPVELADFRVRTNASRAIVSWETLSEDGSARFDVEHADSVAARIWQSVGSVDAAGVSSRRTEYEFVVDGLDPGRHAFRLAVLDVDGTRTITPAIETTIASDGGYDLSAPYPNPGDGEIRFRFVADASATVAVSVFDVLGRRVAGNPPRDIAAGTAVELAVDTSDLAEGIYFVRLVAGSYAATRKVLLVR